VDPSRIPDIIKALRNDSADGSFPNASDPYFFGKQIARQARLVLIADTLRQNDIMESILDRLESFLLPWLVGRNEDYFVYDTVWGGLCSTNGLRGVFWMTDFGNGWYNDHVSSHLLFVE
jgi:endo-1,3(4)-beta-glucanase